MILELIIALVILFVVVTIYSINRIIVLSNRIDNAWAQIDVQLKKRADLVPNLVETVKRYMRHEKEVFEKIAKAREQMMKAGSVAEKAKASSEMTKALKTIFALAENYPNLKANENFKLLQEQLEGIENKIAYARQFYNDSVLMYNNLIMTIPGKWFAAMIGKNKPHEYFEITKNDRKPIRVKFD